MIILKTKKQIDILRQANQIVKRTLNYLKQHIKVGISTLELDNIAEQFIKEQGAEPSFKGFEGFPASICTSVNEVVVHGIPSKAQILKDGDIISIDCGVIYRGYQGDGARTFPVGKVNSDKLKLIEITKQCFFEGIKGLKVGDRIGDIGARIQSFAEKNGFSVVRELVGHGIGKEMHEDPEVPNYGQKGTGEIIENGLVIAIEPMINLGKRQVYLQDNGWGVVTKDHKPSAHYENTVAITDEGVEILSLIGDENEWWISSGFTS